jgi:hypothetical protein
MMTLKWWFTGWVLVGLLFSTAHHMQQQNPDRPLVIVIRNLDGTPAEGISVIVYDLERSGLDRQYTETDSTGAATFMVFYGDYLVAFEGMYQGHLFITPAQQNAGARTFGEVGGFGVFLDPHSDSYAFLFTIAINETGQMVPLYDLAESTASAPVPYTYESGIGDEVMVNSAYTQLDLNRVPGESVPDAPPSQVSAGGEPESFGFDDFLTTLFLIVALVAGGSVLAVMWYILLSQYQKSKGGK